LAAPAAALLAAALLAALAAALLAPALVAGGITTGAAGVVAPVRIDVALCIEAGTPAGAEASCCIIPRHGTPGGDWLAGCAIAAELRASIGEHNAAIAMVAAAARFVVLDMFSSALLGARGHAEGKSHACNLQSRQYEGYRSDTNAIHPRDTSPEALRLNLFHMVKKFETGIYRRRIGAITAASRLPRPRPCCNGCPPCH
jgi:hypothetical protein